MHGPPVLSTGRPAPAPGVVHRPAREPRPAGPPYRYACYACYADCCVCFAVTSRTHGVFASTRLLFSTSHVP